MIATAIKLKPVGPASWQIVTLGTTASPCTPRKTLWVKSDAFVR